MSESRSAASSVGVGLPGLLFLVFLVLKLTDVIDWSWWWVTAPLWIPASVGLLIAGLTLGVAGVVSLASK